MTRPDTAAPDLTLNQETRRWLQRAGSLTPPDDASRDDGRRQRFEIGELLAEEFTAPPPHVTLRDHRVGPNDLLVREYRPPGISGPLPAYVFLHGGSFWHGSVDEPVNHSLVATRSIRAGVATFAVEYRLAPEHPHPAAIEDTEAVLDWLRASATDLGVDRERIVLGGVSAGAAIATATAGRTALRAELAGLLLEVPAIDLRDDGSWDRRFAAANGLESPEEMARIYAPRLAPGHPEVSPMLTTEPAGFPPTHIMTAEYDPLRPGGEILAARLRAAGTTVTATRHLGALHGSPGLTADDPIAIGWQDEVCAVLVRLSRRPN